MRHWWEISLRKRKSRSKGVNGQRGAAERFTPQQVIAALEASGGVNLAAAKMLGCAPSTIANYLARYPEIADAKVEIEFEKLDIAETVVVRRMLSDANPVLQLRAAMFYLTRRGAARGYSKGRGASATKFRIEESIDASALSPEERQTFEELLAKVKWRGTS